MAEAFRVLKPGGRFAVSDVVVRGTLPAQVRSSMELWVGCVAGALSESDYRAKLGAAGFADIDVEVTREYSFEDAKAFLTARGARSRAAGAGGRRARRQRVRAGLEAGEGRGLLRPDVLRLMPAGRDPGGRRTTPTCPCAPGISPRTASGGSS